MARRNFSRFQATQVQYAVNTSSSVLKIGDRYYVCDNGVWFAGLTPTGPWAVADSVPDAVQTIPPSAPVYNVRYVHVYDATPQIVYVGYTPGYIGTYRYHGTVVYGTGYYYRPWIGPVYYYPRPYTWGFNVIYHPWTGGWGFALGYSTPFVNVSIGWRSSYYRYPPYWGGGGWWGPGGYRPIYRPLPGYRPPYRPPNNVIIIRPGRPGYRPGYPGYPNRPGQPGKPGRPPRPTPYARDNIYARPGVSDRVKTDYRPKGKTPKPVTKLPNNVYTDKNGDVYRRNNTGNWDKRENGKWTKPAPANPGTQPARPGTLPAPGTPGTKPAPTNPNTRPAPQPKPGQPSIQPAPNQPQPKPAQPSTRPTRPARKRSRRRLRIRQFNRRPTIHQLGRRNHLRVQARNPVRRRFSLRLHPDSIATQMRETGHGQRGRRRSRRELRRRITRGNRSHLIIRGILRRTTSRRGVRTATRGKGNNGAAIGGWAPRDARLHSVFRPLSAARARPSMRN